MNKKRYKTGTVTITVDYGYDIHSLRLSKRTHDRIVSGKSAEIHGQGFHWEGEADKDIWFFNRDAPGQLYVTTDSGGDIFEGTLKDAHVDIEAPEAAHGTGISRRPPHAREKRY
jgi:hypothetical protein